MTTTVDNEPVELTLVMAAWLQLGHAFQNVPKKSNSKEANKLIASITPKITSFVREQSTPIKVKKNGSGEYKVNTELKATLTLPTSEAELVRDALQSIVDEDQDGTHKWWSVGSLKSANDALTCYSIDLPPGTLEKHLGRPVVDGEKLEIEIEPTDDPTVGKIVSIGGKKVAE